MSEVAKPKIYFVSGHVCISDEEFKEHYVPLLTKGIQEGAEFVVADYVGTDEKAQQFLRGAPVTVFHVGNEPFILRCDTFDLCGGFESIEDRDAAMTAVSDEDIAWVRPGVDRSTTANNIERRKRKHRDLIPRILPLPEKHCNETRSSVWLGVVNSAIRGMAAEPQITSPLSIRAVINAADVIADEWTRRFGTGEGS